MRKMRRGSVVCLGSLIFIMLSLREKKIPSWCKEKFMCAVDSTYYDHLGTRPVWYSIWIITITEVAKSTPGLKIGRKLPKTLHLWLISRKIEVNVRSSIRFPSTTAATTPPSTCIVTTAYKDIWYVQLPSKLKFNVHHSCFDRTLCSIFMDSKIKHHTEQIQKTHAAPCINLKK